MYGNAAAANDQDLTGFLFTLEELESCDTRPKKKKKKPFKLEELQFFENPKNDNEKLFNLQKKYYEAKAAENEKEKNIIYWQMWELVAVVGRRIIINKLSGKGLEFAPDEIEDKVSNTCEYLLRRFIYKKNYYVSTNWITAINGSVVHALYYRTNLDKETKLKEDFNLIKHSTIKNYCGRDVEGEF